MPSGKVKGHRCLIVLSHSPTTASALHQLCRPFPLLRPSPCCPFPSPQGPLTSLAALTPPPLFTAPSPNRAVPPQHWPYHPTTTHCPLRHHRMPTPSLSARSAAAWRRVTTGWCTRLSLGARSWTMRHQRQCTTARLATTTERGMAKAWSPDLTTACWVFVGCWRGICRLF